MFHLTERIKLTALATLALLAGTQCLGCSAAIVWKVDADQHTTGDIAVDIEPVPIPGLTPAPAADPNATTDAGNKATMNATASMYADARIIARPHLAPNRSRSIAPIADN